MDRLCTEKPFLYRRIYAVILVRPCINLHLWLKLGLVPIASSRITATGVILPAVTLAVVVGSKYMRQVRLVILEEMQKDYVIGARARGVSEMKILFGHICLMQSCH